MKKLTILLASLLIVPSILAVSGCNDETVPDPEVQKAANAQRQAMQPGNGTPAQGGPAPGTQGAPSGQAGQRQSQGR